ncbi:macrophage immunometabolism regulator isoform X2 [Myotis myotis]|uniref:macrophage immunometabolism regulator isoform X2 n=1 Tax=Myotis myotis TaxID=51298 RepID=UPI00174BEC6D|nr:macrophage immunometabolism regulator isoform X2 [Myotis myotis]
MEVDVNGEARSTLSTLPLPVAEVSSPGKAEAEKPRCSSTPCSPMRRTVSGYQILHMDSNYLVGFTTGEELLKLAQKCTGGEESKGEAVPSLRSKQLDAGLARSSRLYKTRSRYYQPYEIPAVNGRRRRRMPSSGDKCTKSLPYEPYKALHGPLPLCLLKGHQCSVALRLDLHHHGCSWESLASRALAASQAFSLGMELHQSALLGLQLADRRLWDFSAFLIMARPKVDWLSSLAGVKPRGCLAPEMSSAARVLWKKTPFNYCDFTVLPSALEAAARVTSRGRVVPGYHFPP